MQQRLQVEFPQIALKVNCFLREKTLVILVYVPEIMTLHNKDLLFQLKQILMEEETISSYPMELYLKVNESNSLEAIQVNSSPKGLKPISLSLGLVLALGGIYILTRPCLWGTCPNLTQAEQLRQNALNLVDLSASSQDIATAQAHFKQSSNLLQAIPVWSNYHEQATQLLAIDQQYSQNLDDLAQALAHATTAVSLAKPPLTVEQWQTAGEAWERAIASLKKIPLNSPLRPYTEVKLKQYQGNLTALQQRIKAENQGNAYLKIAQKTAQIALVRQKAAHTLTDWQTVEKAWQDAIKNLEAIPANTLAAQETSNLLPIYTTQLTNAKTRRTQEEAATKFYRQALQYADLAQQAIKNQQWTATVNAWRNAITALKQIPLNTSFYNQAQTLISSYLLALNQAETNLKTASKLQNLRQDLETICKKPLKICDYQISQAIIKINLTESYVKQVWYTAEQAKARTSVPTQVSLLNHIAKLEKSLQTISNEAQKRVEVYNPEQNIIAIYEPNP